MDLNDIIVFHVLDPFELKFPFQGTVEFQGLEAQGRILTRPSELRKSYLEEFYRTIDRPSEVQRELIDACVKIGM